MIEHVDNQGLSALLLAVIAGHAQTVRVLLHGSIINDAFEDRVRQAYVLASALGHGGVVNILREFVFGIIS